MSKVVTWITATPRLLEGVQLINNVEPKKFPLVLTRIAQSMQSSTEELSPFTNKEIDKLLSSLTGVESKDDLITVLDTSSFILLQAAYNVTKPAILQNDLIDLLKMSDSKAEMFCNVWNLSAKGVVDKLRNKSIHDPQLDGLSWMLNVRTKSNVNLKAVEPRAIIELKLQQDDQNSGNIVMDMNKKQLYEFYETLEKVQSELDSLR